MSGEIIINADDFGWTDGHNLAVKLAHKNGNLYRASILCNGNAFEEAINIAKESQGLKVGVHLTLNEGFPLGEKSALLNLVRSDGSFYENATDLVRLWLTGRIYLQEALYEWRSQLDRFIATGLIPSHLDSHKHVHVLPPLLHAIVILAQEYEIGYIRLPLERLSKDILRRGMYAFGLRMLALRARSIFSQKGIQFADNFIGINNSGMMTAKRLDEAFARSQCGLTEIMVHPAKITPDVQELRRKYRWASNYLFEEELSALIGLNIDKQVKH